MQNGDGALALDVATLRQGLAEIERHLERRQAIIVFAHKPSSDADALSGYLQPLRAARDDRSDWQAMRDAWRLRHVSTCFGLAGRSGYGWRIEETDALISVVFEPAGQDP
jgi:hypothetical protein